ncbi:hypothetical protein [Superficieibacter sp. HKU1]|nr:hypothetical protein [Superficieibacter sp. HKU1]WES69081.1 hypothetical protein P0H77_03420 [Superficieibacter sp. HKU1]
MSLITDLPTIFDHFSAARRTRLSGHTKAIYRHDEDEAWHCVATFAAG